MRIISHVLSCSAHRTPNFTNPEFQFPQFKVFFLFNITRYIGIFGSILILNLKLLTGKNTQRVKKKNIRDS